MNNTKQFYDKFLDEIERQRKEHPNDFECEWCGQRYPEDPSNKRHPLGYPYRKLVCRNILKLDRDFKTHIICEDCYDRLKEI